MARPIKSGLDYFPHDTNTLANDKIMIMRTLHGNDGYVFYFGLLEQIYQQPKFEYDISDGETVLVLCKRLMVSRRKFDAMLASALKYGCFDKKLYERTGRLSSSGIKKRASVVVKKRLSMRVRPAASVASVDLTITTPITTPITIPKTPQRKEKERKEKKNQPLTPLTRGAKAVGRSLNDKEKGFEAFWEKYPRKLAKADALKAWVKLAPDDDLQQAMLSALDSTLRSGRWAREEGRYIPHLSTWLNGRRWEDEMEPGQRPEYGQHSDYDQHSEYGQHPEYDHHSEYGQHSEYDQHSEYGQRSEFGQRSEQEQQGLEQRPKRRERLRPELMTQAEKEEALRKDWTRWQELGMLPDMRYVNYDDQQ